MSHPYLTWARRQRSERKSAQGQLRAELGEVEAQISRLVQWIAKGKLVDDLEAQMMAVEARRDRLRRELSGAQAAATVHGVDVLPRAVRKIVSDLRGMLAAGQTEHVKSALRRLVGKIEVHREEVPGPKATWSGARAARESGGRPPGRERKSQGWW